MRATHVLVFKLLHEFSSLNSDTKPHFIFNQHVLAFLILFLIFPSSVLVWIITFRPSVFTLFTSFIHQVFTLEEIFNFRFFQFRTRFYGPSRSEKVSAEGPGQSNPPGSTFHQPEHHSVEISPHRRRGLHHQASTQRRKRVRCRTVSAHHCLFRQSEK